MSNTVRRLIAQKRGKTKVKKAKHFVRDTSEHLTPLSQLLHDKFERMVARVKVHQVDGERVAVDVQHDRKGEYFDLTLGRDRDASAIDVRADQRHLLLAARQVDRLGLPVGGGQRFLCGHDERAWFVAAVPEGRASNVDEAMDALKPPVARFAEERAGLRFSKRHRRRNVEWVRQGEWFFIPVQGFAPMPGEIRRNEALRRSGRSKPHTAEFCVRSGGELVYLHRNGRRAISEQAFGKLVRHKPDAAKDYLQQRRNMQVLVRGRISHAEHATVLLRDWHQVAMNTENESIAMRSVAFID